MSVHDAAFMQVALEQAAESAKAGEIPVGAVVVVSGEIVATGQNRSIRDADPSAHAEVVALRAAGSTLSNYRLTDATLYVTLEPCAMCAGLIVNARLGRVVYGADDPKAGACRSLFEIADDPRLNHRAEIVAGVRRDESASLLRSFFRGLRAGG